MRDEEWRGKPKERTSGEKQCERAKGSDKALTLLGRIGRVWDPEVLLSADTS